MNLKNFDMVDSKRNGYKKDGIRRDSKNYIINEAQMVISNYISNIEEQRNMKGKRKWIFGEGTKIITEVGQGENSRNKNVEKDKRYKILKVGAIILMMLLITNFILM